jgi:hypothetical protein
MSFNTTLLEGDPAFQEKVAAGVVTPGMLVELTAADEVQANGTAADTLAAPTVAVEDSLQGREITDNYAAGEIVKYITLRQGNEAYVIANAAVAVGAKVESAGNGKFQTATTGRVIGVAKTAAAGADERIVIEAV